MNTLKALFLVFALAACAPAEPASPADAAPPIASSTDALSPSGELARADTLRADLTGVPDSLRSCIPAAYTGRPVRFEYIGQMSPAGQPTKVLLEYFVDDAPTAPLDFHPVILNVRASGCTAADRSGTDGSVEEAFLLLTNRESARRSAELHIAAAGGHGAYSNLYRTLTGHPPKQCGSEESPSGEGCLHEALAEAYRSLGVSVIDPQ